MITETVVNLSVVVATCLILVIYLLKFTYRYKHQYESNPLCTFTVAFCLMIVLIITCTLPVDLFFVSYVKNTDGTFKEWATNETLAKIDNGMFAAYYSLYSIAITLIFIVIPFLYFFNDETDSSSRGRLHSALKYTFLFLLLMIALMFIGGSMNKTEKIEQGAILEKPSIVMKEAKVQSAITFVLTIIMMMGFVNVSFYTASGIFSWPIGLILGTASVRLHHDQVSDRADLLRILVNDLREKARTGRLSQREQGRLDSAEDELIQLDREETILSEHRNSWSHKLRTLTRPIQIILGSMFVILSLILLASLIIINIDRLLHGAGMKQGYILTKETLFNPLDYVFTRLQNVIFIGPMPLLIVVCFLVVATISGIRNLGLWFMLARIYRIEVDRTPPRALLFFCMTIMLAALAFNLLLYSTASQYVTFGNQYYISQSTNASVSVIKPCTHEDNAKDCISTRASVLIIRMMSRTWLFGAIFYWSSWIFVAIALVSLIAYVYRGKREANHDTIGANEDEFEN